MIDPAFPLASLFLWVTGSFFLVGFAVPLLLVPVRWAQALQWQIPAGDNHLVEYLGRCLGGVALAIVIVALRAAPDPAANVVLFDLFVLAAALLTGVHVWGAVRGTQPWTENVEIVMYAGVGVATWWVRSTLG